MPSSHGWQLTDAERKREILDAIRTGAVRDDEPAIGHGQPPGCYARDSTGCACVA